MKKQTKKAKTKITAKKLKREDNIFTRKVKHTRIGNWRYISLVFLISLSVVGVYSTLTYIAGFDETESLLVESRKFQVTQSDLLVYDTEESSESGLSSTGSFAVIHEIVISNQDDIDAEFLVSSTISKGTDESVLAERAIVPVGEIYTFRFEHEKDWSEDEFNAEYKVSVPPKNSVDIKNVVSERIIKIPAWIWPW